ncbi:MAG: dUTP diphosphatase [bacterium]
MDGDGEDVAVLVQRLDPDVALPAYALDGDAGADVVTTVDVVLAPGERAVLPTGLAIALPAGYAAFVHPRSGLAARLGLGLVNAPGTIDAGYRGEIKVIAVNLDPVTPVALARGDRVAQLVVQRVTRARWTEVEQLPPSERGTAGHGSTGPSGAPRRAEPALGPQAVTQPVPTRPGAARPPATFPAPSHQAAPPAAGQGQL